LETRSDDFAKQIFTLALDQQHDGFELPYSVTFCRYRPWNSETLNGFWIFLLMFYLTQMNRSTENQSWVFDFGIDNRFDAAFA
jgi:hypothetical protein